MIVKTIKTSLNVTSVFTLTLTRVAMKKRKLKRRPVRFVDGFYCTAGSYTYLHSIKPLLNCFRLHDYTKSKSNDKSRIIFTFFFHCRIRFPLLLTATNEM